MDDEFEYAIQERYNGTWWVSGTYDSLLAAEHDYYIQYDQHKREGKNFDNVRIAKRPKTDWEEV